MPSARPGSVAVLLPDQPAVRPGLGTASLPTAAASDTIFRSRLHTRLSLSARGTTGSRSSPPPLSSRLQTGRSSGERSSGPFTGGPR